MAPASPTRPARHRGTYRRYGVAVQIAGPEKLTAEAAARLLPEPDDLDLGPTAHTGRPLRGYEISAARAPDRWDLRIDGEAVHQGVEREAVLHRIESDAKIVVTSQATGVAFVHAGVVAWGGRALVLPGRTHAGKSTLVEALLAAGATYFSDDYAVLDDDGRVWPCPLRLARRRADGRRDLIPLEALDAEIGRAPVPLGWVLETWYEAGAALAPRPLSPAETALVLLRNAPAARVSPGDVLRRLARACRGGRGLSGARGEAGPESHRILGTILAD